MPPRAIPRFEEATRALRGSDHVRARDDGAHARLGGVSRARRRGRRPRAFGAGRRPPREARRRRDRGHRSNLGLLAELQRGARGRTHDRGTARAGHRLPDGWSSRSASSPTRGCAATTSTRGSSSEALSSPRWPSARDAARVHGERPAHLAGTASLREPFERLVDTGLRMNEIRGVAELHEFLIEEATELSGAERVLLLLEHAGRSAPRGSARARRARTRRRWPGGRAAISRRCAHRASRPSRSRRPAPSVSPSARG